MIGHLKASLAARAELALIDGMVRIALQLFRQPHPEQAELAVSDHFGVALHHPDSETACGRTQRADAGLPGGDAGDQIFVREEANQLLFGFSAPVKRRRRT